MKDLILQLCDYVAPAGSEQTLQEVLLSHVKEYADEVYVDTLGNGIAKKSGTGPHVMLVAHADEPGVMVIHIEDDGFLRLISIGDVDAQQLVGRHIQFTNGVIGVVGVESKVKVQDITFDHLFVDIAADSAEDAGRRVHIGMGGVVVEPVVHVTERRLAGRALDNRVGCAVAIEAFKKASKAGHQVSLVFTAQQVVGGRGAKTAAYQLQPSLAIVIDLVPTGDTPKASRMELKLGAGPAVKILDRTAIVPIHVKDALIDAAEQAKIPVQYEVWPLGISDAGSVQLSVDGIPVGGVSIPARYVGSTSTMIDLRDVEQAVSLLVAVMDKQ